MSSRKHIALQMETGWGQWLGGMQYLRNILGALAQLPSEIQERYELSFLTFDPLSEELQQEINSAATHLHKLPEALPRKSLFKKIRWSMAKRFHKQKDPRFQSFIQEQGIDFLFPYFVRGEQAPDFHYATWVPDFQHKHLPQFFSKKERQQRETYLAQIAGMSHPLVLSSQTALQDFRQWYPQAQAKPKLLPFRTQIPTAWFEANPGETQAKYHVPERFFLVCNQFWQHKNHGLILESLAQLQARAIFPTVVCTGQFSDHRNPDYFNTLLQTVHRYNLAHQVIFLGVLPRQEQIQLMRQCLAVIQPSRFEGWSTVVEDARAVGKTLYLSNLPVHREQQPPHTRYFDPDSPEALAEHLAQGWNLLPAGADPEREQEARQESQRLIQDFGLQFLQLAGVP